MVLLAAEPKHNGAHAEHDCWQQPGAPETNVLLDIDHGDLSSEGTHVDEHVEIQEDT